MVIGNEIAVLAVLGIISACRTGDASVVKDDVSSAIDQPNDPALTLDGIKHWQATYDSYIPRIQMVKADNKQETLDDLGLIHQRLGGAMEDDSSDWTDYWVEPLQKYLFKPVGASLAAMLNESIGECHYSAYSGEQSVNVYEFITTTATACMGTGRFIATP